MATASIRDLGNGFGYLYITAIDGTTFINAGITNDAGGVDTIKSDALNRAPVGTTTSPQGIYEINTITIAGLLTDATIDGVSQFDVGSPITLGLGGEIQAATDLRDAINAYIPASGSNYKATSTGEVVYVAPVDDVGSSLNGDFVSVAYTGTSIIITYSIDGGQDGDEEVSEINGRRYWLDADFGPTGCSGSGTAVVGDLTNAIEITAYVVKRGAEGGLPIDVPSIDVNLKVADYTRLEKVQILEVEPGAPTDIEFVPTNSATIGDTLILYTTGAVSTFTDLTVAAQGNMMLTNQVSFVSASAEESISLRLYNDPTNGLVWVEMWRSIPAIGAGGIGTTELAAVSVTTGKLALLAVDSTILDDDAVTTVKILDLNVTTAKIDDLAVTNTKLGLLSVDTPQLALLAVDSTILDDDAVTTIKILDANITVAKLETSLTKELIVVPVSFEEAGVMGLIKVTIPYDCDVLAINAAVTKLIEATDDATIIPKNNAGTAMTSGQIDLSASAPLGNIFSSAPTANNSFIAGEVLSLESSKTNPGGICLVSVELTRT